MKILMKYVLTNIIEHKIRSTVMLLSVLLSSILVFVSLSIGVSYEKAQQKMAKGVAGNATVSITGNDDSEMISIDELPELASIDSSVGIVETSALYKEDGYYESFDLIGANLSQLNEINKPRMIDGKEINDFTGRKIIIPDRFTSKYGIEIGDIIVLYIKSVPIDFEVVNIAAYDTVFLRHTRGVTALVPVDTLDDILEQKGGFNEILIKNVDTVSASDLVNELRDTLPLSQYKVSKIVNEDQIAANAREKSMPFFLISFFSLTISIFIIYSSYKVITIERMSIIGTFRSVGATQKMVTFIFLLESILYGCVGGVLGVTGGIYALKLILQGMGQSLSRGIEIPAVVLPINILISFIISLVVSVFSAWFPVYRASHLPIKNIILGIIEEKKLAGYHLVAIGSALFVISIILPRCVTGKMLSMAGGFSLLGLIIATIIVIPLITNFTSRFLEYLYGFLFSNEGKLAARNMRNNKSITQNITLLFISISAVIAITVVGNFVTSYISDVFKGAEIQGFADGQMDESFVDEVKKMDGINKILPLIVFENELDGNDHTFSRLEATDSLKNYGSMLAIHYTESDMEEKAISAFDGERSIILSDSFAKKTGYLMGDTLILSNGIEKMSYEIVGIYKSRATDVEAVISSRYAIEDFGSRTYGFLGYTAKDPDAVMIQIRDMFGDTSNWSRTIEEFNTDALSTVGAFLQPMHTMTYFILLLAMVGVINNLLINYMQKRRIIAMYKAIGLSNNQNIRLTLIEAFSTGIIGTSVAVFVSYIEIQTIFIVAGPKISVGPALDFDTFIMAGLAGVFITLLGSVIPIMKGHQMKLIEEIKFE